jgi:hypothetical protein
LTVARGTFSVLHVAYGLRIESNLVLPGLPISSEPETADVQIRLKQRPSFPCSSSPEFFYVSSNLAETEPLLRVGRLVGGEYFCFFYGDGVRFFVNQAGTEVWAHWPETSSLEDACVYLFGPVMAFVLRRRGATCLHASAIVVGDRAIALVGPGGAGKSTTAAAFARLGYGVLSDDVVALADEGDLFLVQPGYPRVNLWPDSVRALFGSEDALPLVTPTWDKRYLPLDEGCYRFERKALPLGAIYVLDNCEAGSGVPLAEVGGSETFMTLVANTYLNYLLDEKMRRRDFDFLGRLFARVPVRHIRPTADLGGVFGFCEAISQDAKRRIASAVVTSGRD